MRVRAWEVFNVASGALINPPQSISAPAGHLGRGPRSCASAPYILQGQRKWHQKISSANLSLSLCLTDEIVRRAGLFGQVNVVVGRGRGRRGRLAIEEPIPVAAAAVDGTEAGAAVVAERLEQPLFEGVGAGGDATLHCERGRAAVVVVLLARRQRRGIICGEEESDARGISGSKMRSVGLTNSVGRNRASERESNRRGGERQQRSSSLLLCGE